MSQESKIIVALDKMSCADSLKLAKQLAESVWGFKVNDLLIAEGVSIIERLRKFANVFADAKVHEIPNTTANSVSRLADAGANLITVHASGGETMLSAATEASGSADILAVTVLTSLAENDARGLFGRSAEDATVYLAGLAAKAGAWGIVCSPKELRTLARVEQLSKLQRVCPGVRPEWYGVSDDQKRVATPVQAVADGAGLLVIGRPITTAEDPVEAVAQINEELAA